MIENLTKQEFHNKLNKELQLHSSHIQNMLKNYSAIDLFPKWHSLVQSLEEFINLIFFGNFTDKEKKLVESTSITFPPDFDRLMSISNIIGSKYKSKTRDRFFQFTIQTIAISHSFKITDNGIEEFNKIKTLLDVANYYQKRRRYFVTLLYLIPKHSQGNNIAEKSDLLNIFLPIIELNCVSLTTINQQRVLSKIFNDYQAKSDGQKLEGNYTFQPLERFSNEPERLSIFDQVLHRNNQIEQFNWIDLDRDKIFSKKELLHSIQLIEKAYALYKIDETDFKIFSRFINEIVESISDDYFFTITKSNLEDFISFYSIKNQKLLKNQLFQTEDDYWVNLNSFHPFIELEDKYYTNVNLLMRFLYYFKNFILNKKKKFQIHAGFVFEDMIKKILENYNFQITDITRINQKEFDVVTIRDKTIYNFQCKNNAIDLTLIESDQEKFIRYNKYLIRSLQRALKKEYDREKLLIDKLKINKIEHFVITRFPILNSEERIISFNEIESWLESNFA
ncbi:hypothetical protein [Gillisia sp. JM1]|uniref:hypothetical protein n=1 Tax=Gillisia sp. JM1 TaxID=1283286 RepID=UPI0003F5A5D4|nr:hypothetical protein [Gillisia sp. JM1]